MPNSTVWNIIRKFQTTKEVTDLPRTGRPRCMKTPKKIKTIKGKSSKKPKKIDVELGMSRFLEMNVTFYP